MDQARTQTFIYTYVQTYAAILGITNDTIFIAPSDIVEGSGPSTGTGAQVVASSMFTESSIDTNMNLDPRNRNRGNEHEKGAGSSNSIDSTERGMGTLESTTPSSSYSSPMVTIEADSKNTQMKEEATTFAASAMSSSISTSKSTSSLRKSEPSQIVALSTSTVTVTTHILDVLDKPGSVFPFVLYTKALGGKNTLASALSTAMTQATGQTFTLVASDPKLLQLGGQPLPTSQPTSQPSTQPSRLPSSQPSSQPTALIAPLAPWNMVVLYPAALLSTGVVIFMLCVFYLGVKYPKDHVTGESLFKYFAYDSFGIEYVKDEHYKEFAGGRKI